jgi:hypothetical protein
VAVRAALKVVVVDLEHVGEKPMALRLTSLIERGADFERVAYESAK